MPPRDKIRPWVTISCSRDDCEFKTTAEWAALRHEAATGHRMTWWRGTLPVDPLPDS